MLNYIAQIADLNKTFPTSLKEVITAGEQLIITPVIRSFFKILKHCRLINQYGPSETHVVTSFTLPKNVNQWGKLPPIGKPISNIQLKILNEKLTATTEGELFICAPFIAKGYVNNPKDTNKSFIPDPQNTKNLLYATGDIVKLNKKKQLEFVGRKDDQVKISGYRIELAEIEYLLSKDKNVLECAVCPIMAENRPTFLVAFIVLKNEKTEILDIKQSIGTLVPNYMTPKDFVVIDKLPRTPSGKLDRKVLIQTYIEKKETTTHSELTKLEEIWRDLLHITDFDKNKTFFELGGTSLLLLQLYTKIFETFKQKIPVAMLLKNSTFNAVSDLLKGNIIQGKEAVIQDFGKPVKEKIAVIGMACNFPKCHTPDEFWNFLSTGKESIESFGPSQDLSMLDPFEHDVFCSSTIDDANLFDAEFFGYSKTEAEMMDPQQRKFLELSWELLEKTGYLNNNTTKKIGVFASQGFSSYLVNNLNPNLDYRSNRYFFERFSDLQVMMGGDKDYLPTKVSFKLGLEGPSINVQSACSSSLVAIHLAKQALLNGECEMALVGAVNIMSPSKHKYTFQKDMPWSPDGHTRTFDERSEGMMMAQGLGVVLLKPLSKAIKDKDNILAIISGSGVSNDGNNGKSNFLAPTIDGQTRSLQQALKDANILPDKISFIETHGTGTVVGDAVEIQALKNVFGNNRKRDCVIGSVKTNIGHLGWASGMAGIIKAILCIQHKQIPATLHFKKNNPLLELDDSPFYVNNKTIPWKSKKHYCLVNSFGLGGTNANVILESYSHKKNNQTKQKNNFYLFVFSGKKFEDLVKIIHNHRIFFENHRDLRLQDISYSLLKRKYHFDYRVSFVANTMDRLIYELSNTEKRLKLPSVTKDDFKVSQKQQLAFIFSGYTSQYFGMGKRLYEKNAIFKKKIQECNKIIKKFTDFDLIDIIWKQEKYSEQDVILNQLAIVAIEVSILEILKQMAILPKFVLGHSLGEYVAAYCAGILKLNELLQIVYHRAVLLTSLKIHAKMLAIRANKNTVEKLLENYNEISIASINTPNLVVVSGPTERILSLFKALHDQKIEAQKLDNSSFGHSSVANPLVAVYKKYLSKFSFKDPFIKLLSNVTGDFIQTGEISSDYWCNHMIQPVNFENMIHNLKNKDVDIFLEIGPNSVLLNMVAECYDEQNATYIPMMRKTTDDTEQLLSAFGKLFSKGISVNFDHILPKDNCLLIELPTYPFDLKKYYLEPVDLLQKASWRNDLYKIQWESVSLSNFSKSYIENSLIIGDKSQIAHFSSEKNLLVSTDISNNSFFLKEKLDSFKKKIERIVYVIDSISDDVQNYTSSDILRLYLNKIKNVFYSLKEAFLMGKIENISFIFVGNDFLNESLVSLLKTICLENSEIKCSCFFAKALTENSISKIASCIRQQKSFSFFQIDPGGKSVFEATLAPISLSSERKLTIVPKKQYLVTGGVGALGLLTSKWLIKNGAKRIVIVGRREKNEVIEQIRTLKLLDDTLDLEYISMDISDESKFFALSSKLDIKNIGGIVHAAGCIEDKSFTNTTMEDFKKIAKAKVLGVWNLHKLSLNTQLDFFVVFSSAVSVIGNPGQSNYTTANAFLDSVCKYRISLGLPALSINWGAWGDLGTIDINKNLQQKLEEKGYSYLKKNDFDEIMSSILSLQEQVILLPMNWNIFLRKYKLENSPFFRLLAKDYLPVEEKNTDTLTQYSIQDIPSIVSSEVARVLDKYTHNCHIEKDDDLFDLGLDSLSAIELRNAIRHLLNISFPVSVVFKERTLRNLTAFCIKNCSSKSLDKKLCEKTEIVLDKNNSENKLSYEEQRWVALERIKYGYLLIPILFHCELKKNSFLNALKEVISRHPILTHCYVDNHYETCNIKDFISSESIFVNMKGVENVAEYIKNLACTLTSSFPDITKTPPWILKILKLNNNQFICLLFTHHLPFDGTSVTVFVEELRKFYASFLQKSHLRLPNPVLYDQYVDWQHKFLLETEKENEAFFGGLYAGIARPVILPNKTGDEFFEQCYPSSCYTIFSSEKVYESLNKFAHKAHVSVFSVLLFVYSKLLVKLTRQHNLLIGTVFNGRTEDNFKETIGPFVKQFPLPISLDETLSNMTQITQINSIVSLVNERSYYPVNLLPKYVEKFLNFSRSSYFTDAYIMLNNYHKEKDNVWPKVEVLETLGTISEPLLNTLNYSTLRELAGLFLIVDMQKSNLRFNFWYHVHRFDINTIKDWASLYISLLEDTVKEE